jgi:predicted TIM-barrel fold metal-dependent hydrolase
MRGTGFPHMLNDAHCHFFSATFFTALARQRSGATPTADADPLDTSERLCRELQWDPPGSAAALSDRWVAELDAHGVDRAALIASVPGDEESVAAAVARHPRRFVGFFMLDPGGAAALERATHALDALGMRAICLFPAMHQVPLDDDRTRTVVQMAANTPGTVVFVHCGVLSVGVRRRLGLPSRFNLRLGDPLAVARLALEFPAVPFVIPHFGAGLFREALMAADTCSNILFDTSSSNSWIRYTPDLSLESVLRTSLAVLGPERLLFGSDSSFFPRGWQASIFAEQQRVLKTLGTSPDDRELIFGGNFNRLFP